MRLNYRPAILTAFRNYNRSSFLRDMNAGVLVALVAVPLSMALAVASGCTPEQGLWTAIIGGFLISLCGGTRVQIGGPAGAFVGLCAVGVNQFGYNGLAIATLMAGILILFMGIARLGKAVSYIPMPVVIGFTTGIALILCSTQIAPALGIPEPTHPNEHLHERVTYVLHSIANWDPRALCICGLTIVIITIARRLYATFPGGLLALLVVTIGAQLLGWNGEGGVATITTRFGEIPHGLPWPSIPSFGLADGANLPDILGKLRDLSALALAIALLGSIESLLSAVVSDGMANHRHDSNSELIGQGIANIVVPFFQGMPATGVIARTATNVRAGATTPIAGMVHALIVLLIMVVAAPIVGHVPMAALAGVLLVVCWHMAEFRHWPHILKAGRDDAFLLPLAFLLTAFVGLTEAILTGVTLAMFFFVKRMSEHIEINRHEEASERIDRQIPPGVNIYRVRGPFFFGAATRIRDLEDASMAPVTVLRLGDVPFIDATAAYSLRELAKYKRTMGHRLILSDLSERVRADIMRHGLDIDIGQEHLFSRFEEAILSLESITPA